jgi:serpin B
VKAGKKISGVVSDEFGPLFGATVCEIDGKGRIVESTITDDKGHFTMKVLNPQDRLRFSYVGMITVIHAINRTKFKIVMQSATQIKDVRVMPRRSSTDNGLLIPLQEWENATKYIDMSEFEGLNIEPEGSGVSNENNPRVHINLTDEEQTLVTSVNDLGFNMFRKVGTNESILLSPLGMTYALGLINNGAGGKTRTQISKVLGCNDTGADKINGFCRKMLTEAPRIDKLTAMEITNEFFSPISYKLKPAFKEVAIDKYDTQFKNMESDQLKYTLVNTIYFKSVWTDKFRKANTRDEVFRGEDGKEKTVPMMNQIHKYFYTENDLCQTLCLPYSNGAYQMIVLLPKEGKTVQEVAQSLMADSWKKMYDQMRRVDVDVKLPRFESSSEVNLTRIMSALGMPDAFSMEKADFRNLFDLQSCIGMIKQLGRIKVDETGTEATVATILQGRIAGLDIVQPETIRFHATHPFLYFIREWSSGTIFFIGQYMGTSN